MARLDSASSQDVAGAGPGAGDRSANASLAAGSRRSDAAGATASSIVHRFDTERGDLERRGLAVELHERQGNLMVLIAMAGTGDESARAQAQIDRSWACEILAGTLSPLAALERRLGRPGPAPLATVQATIGDQPLQRVDSQLSRPLSTAGVEPDGIETDPRSSVSRAV
jgi:hypothetical protein